MGEYYSRLNVNLPQFTFLESAHVSRARFSRFGWVGEWFRHEHGQVRLGTLFQHQDLGSKNGVWPIAWQANGRPGYVQGRSLCRFSLGGKPIQSAAATGTLDRCSRSLYFGSTRGSAETAFLRS